ncbi:hypothetical protein B0H16DRAFT_1458092 [Mycena metata]|uniref:Uncharacterized protein n=1 Tax=Mycena metata TaxID=1033252 RepID=A0AAD7J8A6_9AGAR|nr:hypothetical protein B0H16DRAFT_1458092 [Mycena metata]
MDPARIEGAVLVQRCVAGVDGFWRREVRRRGGSSERQGGEGRASAHRVRARRGGCGVGRNGQRQAAQRRRRLRRRYRRQADGVDVGDTRTAPSTVGDWRRRQRAGQQRVTAAVVEVGGGSGERAGSRRATSKDGSRCGRTGRAGVEGGAGERACVDRADTWDAETQRRRLRVQWLYAETDGRALEGVERNATTSARDNQKKSACRTENAHAADINGATRGEDFGTKGDVEWKSRTWEETARPLAPSNSVQTSSRDRGGGGRKEGF